MNETPANRRAAPTDADVTKGAAVRIRGLRKSYGPVRAVNGVELTIAPGEVVALLGPNGAGKSTTVDMLLGLSRPDEGEVRIFGRTPREAVTGGVVGAVLQEGALLEDATVGEVVGTVHALYRTPLPLAEVLRRAGVEELRGRRCTKLSGGQKQRVRFALALVADPDLLVLDEPTTGMDVVARRAFWEAMRELTAAGRTVLFATHYLDEAEEFADRVVLMRDGGIAADGSVAEVRAAASGRTLRAVVPGASRAELAALPGVTAAELRGEQAVLTCHDSDATNRALVTGAWDVRDVEIGAAGLEEAFLILTRDAAPGPAPDPAPAGGRSGHRRGAPPN